MAETRVRSRRATQRVRVELRCPKRDVSGSQRRRHSPTAAPGRHTLGQLSGNESLRSSAGGGRRLSAAELTAPAPAPRAPPSNFTNAFVYFEVSFGGVIEQTAARAPCATERRTSRLPSCCHNPGCYGAAGKHPTCCCPQPQKKRADS